MVRITEDLVRKKSEHNECLISTLEEISLHQEDIEKIEHIHNWCRDLKILLLQSNLISKIENLYKFKKLEYLNLAINNIERIENLEQLESLTKLDLTLNFIGDLTSVESLRDNYNLEELYLTGNPCADYPNYRDYVIIALPQLNRLDSEHIYLSDRLLARKNFEENRRLIVDAQLRYNIERDEQKIRYAEQKAEMERKMETIEDEDERTKLFWDMKTEHCPEVRNEIHEQQKKTRSRRTKDDEKPPKKPPQFFAPCGRPYNMNQAKLQFRFTDEMDEYILELKVYKYLDTAYLNVDVQPQYFRVMVKGKVFQIALSEEVETSSAVVQRSQITGELLIKAPKVNGGRLLKGLRKSSGRDVNVGQASKVEKPALSGTVDYKNILSDLKEVKKQIEEPPTKDIDLSDVPDLEWI